MADGVLTEDGDIPVTDQPETRHYHGTEPHDHPGGDRPHVHARAPIVTILVALRTATKDYDHR